MTSYLSRRAVLKGIAGLGVGATLAGCSAPVLSGLGTGGDAAGSLAYWNLFGGGDGVRMQQMLDAFRAANPDIDLEGRHAGLGQPVLHQAVAGDARRQAAGRGGLAPDPDEDAGRGGPARRSCEPEDLARHGMTPDKFNQRAWEAGLVDGKAYAIPIDTHPFVMFYNTDICEKAGLLDSDGKLDADRRPGAFIDAHAKAKEVTGQYGGAIGDQLRHLDAVADLPVAVPPARRRGARRRRHAGRARRRQGHAGARRSCSR